MKTATALLVNPYWDTLGGGERYTATVAHLLLSHGWHVHIIGSPKLVEPIRSRFGLDLAKAKFVGSDVYTAKYQLVFWVSDGSLPLSFATKTLIHFQFPFHSIGGRKLSNQLKKSFYTFVVNSGFTKKFIDREFGVDSAVLYPPIDTKLFTPGVKEPLILYVGRFSQLTQKKNHHLLIEQFKTLHARLPNWKLVLAGGVGVGTDTTYLNQLVSSAKKLPVEFVTNPTLKVLHSLYSHASIFWSASGFGVNQELHPTEVEHFGMSLVEAMSAGCVPIVSNLGGHPEIVTPQTGFLCDHPADLSTHTLKLVNHPDKLRHLGHLAHLHSQQFSLSTFSHHFFALIK